MGSKPSVGVIGLGYVGLPLALAFAEAGAHTIGLDVDERKVQTISRGESHIEDVPASRIAAMVDAGLLCATADFSLLAQVDNIVICVPTPLTSTREPDMTAVIAATTEVVRHLRRGQLVVLESTTYPGTTDEVLCPILAASGLEIGKDLFVGYSPERIDPGSTNSSGYNLRNTPKIVSGVTEACLQRTLDLYSLIVETPVPVSSPRSAETVKLFENVFRVVNVALVNEMALLCDRMGMDVWEILNAAGTKPYGLMKFLPGPGVGGHCIPIDPFYLTWKAREYGFTTKFIEIAGEINLTMPRYVVDLIQRALNEDRKSVNGSRILLIGVAYKKDISDVRESPALAVWEQLSALGGCVTYHDPQVPHLRVAGKTHQSTDLTPQVLQEADCAVILTDHSALDLEVIVQSAPRIVDTRNATSSVAAEREKIIML
jgi:UDP-N-acetyl-D-glucosamine dehydrogenase